MNLNLPIHICISSYGGMWDTCICPKTTCGGVRTDQVNPTCPEHANGVTKAWTFHDESHCPGPLA